MVLNLENPVIKAEVEIIIYYCCNKGLLNSYLLQNLIYFIKFLNYLLIEITITKYCYLRFHNIFHYFRLIFFYSFFYLTFLCARSYHR